VSIVTGFVLICASSEALEWSETPPGNIARINAWLGDRNFAAIIDLAEPHAVGSKHPQLYLYAAGYNHFLEDEFIAFFHSLLWAEPERCVLVLQPEDGAARVIRPDAKAQHKEPA
jgi:hypothetical protein